VALRQHYLLHMVSSRMKVIKKITNQENGYGVDASLVVKAQIIVMIVVKNLEKLSRMM